MTEEEIKNKISEHKECCKKLAEEYRQRYNEDNTDKLALNMFYHNVISYNDFETILATIENRNSMIMCFSNPPILTEETVEVDIKRIADLEKENADLKEEINKIAFARGTLEEENAELNNFIMQSKKDGISPINALIIKNLGNQLTKAKEIIKGLKAHLDLSDCVNNDYRLQLLKQAEQFLSEVEK